MKKVIEFMKVGKSENQHSEEIKLFDYFLYINFTFSCEATTAIRLICGKNLKTGSDFYRYSVTSPFYRKLQKCVFTRIVKNGLEMMTTSVSKIPPFSCSIHTVV